MEPGLIVVVVVVVLFYVRLYVINRGRRRREKQATIQRMKMGKKAPPMPAANPDAPAFNVKSWWVIVPAILLMLVGIAVYTQAFLPDYRAYWWVPIAVGGLLFMFGIE